MNFKSLWPDHYETRLELLTNFVFWIQIIMWSIPHDLTISFWMIWKGSNRSILVFDDITIIIPDNDMESPHNMGVIDISLFELVFPMSIPNSHILR